MEQVPLTRNGHTDFGTVQWETQGRSLMVTVWCPLLLDDIYRAYWQDQTGEKHLLFVLEPKNERLFGQKKWTVNPFSLPPKSAWIQGKHEPEFTENPENAAEPAPERAKESVATQQLSLGCRRTPYCVRQPDEKAYSMRPAHWAVHFPKIARWSCCSPRQQAACRMSKEKVSFGFFRVREPKRRSRHKMV